MAAHILGITRENLETFVVAGSGSKSSAQRAARLFEGIYGRQGAPIWPPVFPAEVHQASLERLRECFDFQLPLRVSRFENSAMDGSSKLVMSLADGLEIETVLIPERGRLTQCLSTQVGCA
ncbi:MAG: hypothetical protein RI932_1481, partial [Pseudomonadota bacterium]